MKKNCEENLDEIKKQQEKSNRQMRDCVERQGLMSIILLACVFLLYYILWRLG